MTDEPVQPPERPANLTRAGVTGKVPQIVRASRGRSGKRVKITGSRKRHVGDLKKHGQISQSVAARHGV